MTHAESFSPTALQAALDDIEPTKVLGAPDERATIVGIDVIPGIVVTQANGKLEAPGVVYLEVSPSGHSNSRRATIQFHVANDVVVIDSVTLA